MTIPSSHMKERLSIAYIRAIAARAGVKLYGNDDVTEYGVDGYFQQIRRLSDGSYKEAGFQIQFQVKATTTAFFRNDKVVYDMKVEAYNKLINVVEDDSPTFFILFRMPPDDEIDKWVALDDEQLVIRRCCYWDYIKGLPVTNKSGIRIEIPIQQRLTPGAILDFFKMLKEGKL